MPANTFDNGVFDVALFDALDSPVIAPPAPIVFVPPAVGYAVEYQVRLYDPQTGLQTAVFTDWNSLYYYNRVSDFGYHTFSMSGADPRRSLFVTDAIFEVWRRNLAVGLPWYRDYTALHRTSQDQITDRGDKLFTSYGRSPEDLLHRREILYYAGTPGDTKSGALDDVMKAYVRENAGSAALAGNGRLRTGVIPGFSVAVNAGLGPQWSGSSTWKNLLSILQEMAQVSPIDFDVQRSGPTTFLFQTYVPRLGTDRSGAVVGIAPVVFSLAHDNMSAPYGITSRTDESNVIIVLGAGEETSRAFVVTSDLVTAQASPWNDIERTVDRRNILDASALTAEAQHELNNSRATREISFTAIDTLGVAYGRDFFMGDLVLSQFVELEEVKKVIGVEITVAEGKEDIRFHFDAEVLPA